VAKYTATEAGNQAAEDAIQALGGYGYVKEYMVEKIKRDVRITCIYEGTNEIMEWTIARDRWQQHLKTKGAYYNDWAKRLEILHEKESENGAGYAALAMRALAVILEQARVDRLTRNQHILFRLGELIAWAETAAIFAERVMDKPTEGIALDIPTRQALSRIYARQAAFKVGMEGMEWLIGAGQTNMNLGREVNSVAIFAAQMGQISDMDFAAGELTKAFPVN